MYIPGQPVSESHKKKLMQKLSTTFPEINFITYHYNKVLMYPNSLTINKVVLEDDKELFVVLVIMMGGFHLLLMLLGVIGSRFGDAGLRELAVQSDIVAEGSGTRL